MRSLQSKSLMVGVSPVDVDDPVVVLASSLFIAIDLNNFLSVLFSADSGHHCIQLVVISLADNSLVAKAVLCFVTLGGPHARDRELLCDRAHARRLNWCQVTKGHYGHGQF